MFTHPPFPFQLPAQWFGDLPVTSRYTYGIALEKFFQTLKDEGIILGSPCGQCGKTYVPITLFCPECLAELHETIDVGLQGEIFSYTLLYKKLDGTLRETPEIIAYIKIADGGLIHRVEGILFSQVKIGMQVAADLKPKDERVGSILDIRAFKPIS
ncbi:MAG: Zn-ribbon domain-containing OB-fold protein [Anaerolineales bacterium]